ncbi:MAG: ATP-binding cassette domain-containing protein [Euryarchaeota archaeon]|nr:ATP-binding cassette domain-containing protein [Euryarchaeota archaeon]
MPSFTPSNTKRDPSETNADEESTLPIGLTLLAGAIAAVVITPVLWVLFVALSVDPESAFSLIWDTRTRTVLTTTTILIVTVTTLSVLLSVPLAFLTTLTDLPGKRLWSVVLALPLVIPSYVGAFAFISIWGPKGIVQGWLSPLGVESLPAIYGLPGTIFILTLYNYPFVYLTTIAGLRAFDKTFLEAARTLETNLVSAIRYAVLPLIKPAVTAGALLTALETAADFGVPTMMRLDVFTRVIYVQYNSFNLEYAALLSLHLAAIALVIVVIESQVRGHDAIHGEARGGSRSYTYRLGRWKWPALALCSTVVLFTLVMPVAILFMWLVHGPVAYAGGLEFDWEYATNSVSVSLLAAGVAAAMALPIAYLSAQYDSLLGRIFERATYLGFAIPGVVIGLSLVYFGSRHVPSIYQTIPLVVFAYVVMYLPLAVGSTRTSILYINPRLTEAARMLGSSPIEAFRRVVFPLMIPGVVAGSALVFLHGMKELPATLMVRPIGFETLATFVWMVEGNAYYGYAAIPALLLIFVSGFSILAVLPRDDEDPRLRKLRRLLPGREDSRDPNDEFIIDSSDWGDLPTTEGRESSTDGGVALSLDGVSKRYGGEPAVDEFSCSVPEGELLTLVGPSGCGKTTTLRLIGGLERPTSGKIRLHGEIIADETNGLPPEERNVGIVFQDFALFPHKTVAENVAFGLRAVEKSERETAIDELLSLVGLSEYADHYPAELSGGQKQRVALARSLAPKPDLLLLDEPLSNLDAGLRIEMREAIREIVKTVGVTAVWVTHDQEEALSISDRVAVMHGGRIEQIDGPKTVFTSPDSRTVAEFLGHANYLPAREENGVIETPIGPIAPARIATDEYRASSERLDILVRPDDIAIIPTASDAHGRVVYSRFNGPEVFYRVALETGTVVGCTGSHDEWIERGTAVRVELTASHPLRSFTREDE